MTSTAPTPLAAPDRTGLPGPGPVTFQWGEMFGDNAYRALFLPYRAVSRWTHDRAGIMAAATAAVNELLPDWIHVTADGQVTYEPGQAGDRVRARVDTLVDTAIVQVGLNPDRMSRLWQDHARKFSFPRLRQVRQVAL